MKHYKFLPWLMLRVPRYPVENSCMDLQELLNQPDFRQAIYLASDAVYNELSRNGFLLANCSTRMVKTLARYRSRMSYRATPFGAFAGVSVLKWNEAEDSGILLKEDTFKTSVLKKKAADHCQEFASSDQFCVNPFLYRFGSDFRLIQMPARDGQTAYSVSEIFGEEVIVHLANKSSVMTRTEIHHILTDCGISGSEIDWYMNELLALQVILPQEMKPASSKPVALDPVLASCPGSDLNAHCQVTALGSFPLRIKSDLQDALHALEKINGDFETDLLSEFKKQFVKVFDRKEVPLLHALDPEIGIDYDDFRCNQIQDTESGKSKSICWSSLHELVLAKWTSLAASAIPIIELDDTALSTLQNPKQKPFPPGMQIMFSVAGEKLHVKAAGGVSALNLIGRFTPFDSRVLTLAREIAEIEQANNPGIVFAEITHEDSMASRSVNRRALLYEYQIPFFESRQLSDDFVIGLSDLSLSLVDNELVLRSATLNKRVVPRLSSAYNYRNSSLPVFRFLCDMQYQGADSLSSFSVEHLFPGLPAYPRVTYKNVILEAASWQIKGEVFTRIKQLTEAGQTKAFRVLAAELGLPDEFCYQEHDHLLHINLLRNEDIELLLQTVVQKSKVVLREYFPKQETFVRDSADRSYSHELIAFVLNKTAVYPKFAPHSPPVSTAIPHKDKHYPFDEWLYLKVYLHPAGYKQLIINFIFPFIKENLDCGNITAWFFLSYKDNDYHLRIRVRQTIGREALLLKSYRKLESAFQLMPNILRIEISTYQKETERYSVIGIEQAEELFQISSELVVNDLGLHHCDNANSDEFLFIAVRHVLLVTRGLGWQDSEILRFAKPFNHELKRQERFVFNQEFRRLNSDLRTYLAENAVCSNSEERLISLLKSQLTNVGEIEKFTTLVDLIHMHLNRLFLYDQLSSEAKTYYLLEKFVASLIQFRSPR